MGRWTLMEGFKAARNGELAKPGMTKEWQRGWLAHKPMTKAQLKSKHRLAKTKCAAFSKSAPAKSQPSRRDAQARCSPSADRPPMDALLPSSTETEPAQ